MQLVIVAGGKGTRLRERLGSLPKPMAEVGGKPILEHEIVLAKKHGIQNILLLVGYGAESIRHYFGNGSRWGVAISYHEETQPLGTAGAVLDVLARLDERFIVMYGDTMMNVDLQRFVKTHEASGASISILVHPNDHPTDSDLVEVDNKGRVIALHPYPHDHKRYYANLVNAALYVIDRKALEPYAAKREFVDFGKHLLPFLVEQNVWLNGYRSPEYIKDAGTPERLDKVNQDFQSGRIERGSFATPWPAVFLDRDGTLNEEAGYVRIPEHLRLFEGTPQAVKRLNALEVRVVVITNQPVIARGECTEDGLKQIHNKLETELGLRGAYLDGIYYCPHHPHGGFPGERAELKIECSCRKPATGLIEQAASELNLDIAQSWMIGDTSRDVEAAQRAGLRSILVRNGRPESQNMLFKPDIVVADLAEAVDFLTSRLNTHDSGLLSQ